MVERAYGGTPSCVVILRPLPLALSFSHFCPCRNFVTQSKKIGLSSGCPSSAHRREIRKLSLLRGRFVPMHGFVSQVKGCIGSGVLWRGYLGRSAGASSSSPSTAHHVKFAFFLLRVKGLLVGSRHCSDTCVWAGLHTPTPSINRMMFLFTCFLSYQSGLFSFVPRI